MYQSLAYKFSLAKDKTHLLIHSFQYQNRVKTSESSFENEAMQEKEADNEFLLN